MTETRGSALGLIGNTPLVHLARIHPGPGKVFAKAEFLNPGGSVKDRAARAIVERARADGQLAPGQAMVAMTSGNFGSGLALVGAVLDHPVIAVMSRGNSPERAAMIRAFAAEVLLVDQVDGGPGEVTGADIAAADAQAARIAQELGALLIDQFGDPASVAAHRTGTGPELLAQAGRIDAFVAAVGSGGTFIGVAAALKAARPKTLCIAVEPEGCAPLGGGIITKPRHLLQGAGYALVPPHWDAALMDESMTVTDAEAAEWRARLGREEGLHVGFTAAANACAAVRVATMLGEGATVATILCDTGLKYPGS